MTAKIDQKAYLQKYLTGSSGDKKKKKKKAVKSNRLKIIDDDIDVSKLRALDGDELDILDQGEDAPQIAGIIDERPEEVKKLEAFKTNSKWRVINQDDGFNSKLQIEEIKKDKKEQEKENEIIFGKMYSDSEDEQKKDSDASPPRKSSSNNKPTEKSQNNSDSDISPPRKTQRNDSDSNARVKEVPNSHRSSPRKSDKSRERPSENKESRNRSTHSKKGYDSDLSPPRSKRTQDGNDSDLSPPRRKEDQRSKDRQRKKSRWGTFEEEAKAEALLRKRHNEFPERSEKTKSSKGRRDSSSDISPPRKSRRESPKRSTRHISPEPTLSTKQGTNKDNFGRRNKNDSDSDLSPPRKNRKQSPPRNRQRTPDSDASPPRKSRKQSPPRSRKKSPDSDPSPPRKNRKGSPQRNRRKTSDSDPSPPRKSRKRSPEKLPYQRSSNSPPPLNKKMARTLDGKLAGLQDATQLRNENDAFRRREDAVFSSMNDEVSGRNAQVVSRKISKRETSEERRKLVEKAERQKELDEKYKKWNKGLKQVEDQQARAQDFLHEAAKPLARHKDDKDLERSLKQVERAGDPMLQYMRERKRERGELGPEKPVYKGNCPPNRFNIRPGYRWDGVDRSNGYESKYFETQSKKRAQAEEYHKWSCADL